MPTVPYFFLSAISKQKRNISYPSGVYIPVGWGGEKRQIVCFP